MICICLCLLIAVLGGFVIIFLLLKKKKKRHGQSQSFFMLTEWDKRFMAYHEAGHAVCSYFLPEREKLILITLDPSSEAFGMIRTEVRSHHNETRTSLSSMISTLLGGRLAEEIFLDSLTTSCIHDFASAQRIAFDMVTKFGMGKELGLTAINNIENMRIDDTHAGRIYEDVQQIIKEAENNARKILLEKKHLVISLAEELLIRKTLSADDISSFFNTQDENR